MTVLVFIDDRLAFLVCLGALFNAGAEALERRLVLVKSLAVTTAEVSVFVDLVPGLAPRLGEAFETDPKVVRCRGSAGKSQDGELQQAVHDHWVSDCPTSERV